MKKIDVDRIYTYQMFSKEGWKEVNRLCDDVRENQHNIDNIALADGFMDFVMTWLDDNDFNMDIENYETDRNKFIYYNDGDDEEYYTEGKTLEDMLLDRWADYLLYD